jgi:hypothetical protein
MLIWKTTSETLFLIVACRTGSGLAPTYLCGGTQYLMLPAVQISIQVYTWQWILGFVTGCATIQIRRRYRAPSDRPSLALLTTIGLLLPYIEQDLAMNYHA